MRRAFKIQTLNTPPLTRDQIDADGMINAGDTAQLTALLTAALPLSAQAYAANPQFHDTAAKAMQKHMTASDIGRCVSVAIGADTWG